MNLMRCWAALISICAPVAVLFSAFGSSPCVCSFTPVRFWPMRSTYSSIGRATWPVVECVSGRMAAPGWPLTRTTPPGRLSSMSSRLTLFSSMA